MHRIVAWGKLAESAAKFSKGAHIKVEGELRNRTYQKKVTVAQKAVAVDIPVSEVDVRVLRACSHGVGQGSDPVPFSAADGDVVFSRLCSRIHQACCTGSSRMKVLFPFCIPKASSISAPLRKRNSLALLLNSEVAK